MPDDILQDFLKVIIVDKENPHYTLINRLMCVKKVINGSPIFFSERQVQWISRKYDEFSQTRKNLSRISKKSQKMNRIMQEENQKMPFNPRLEAK